MHCPSNYISASHLLEDLPNAGMVFGYTNASWSLKADLITEWMCRLLNHMNISSQRIVIPKNFDNSVEHRPFVDMESSYVQRTINKAPHQQQRRAYISSLNI